MHECPVCAYRGLSEPPHDAHRCASFDICPCCGTEFGNDDATVSHAELRTRWVSNGRKWWSRSIPPPTGWDPARQLAGAPFEPCECCGATTIKWRGQYEICSVCLWEDDPAQSKDADRAGGANKQSLNEAIANFQAIAGNHIQRQTALEFDCLKACLDQHGIEPPWSSGVQYEKYVRTREVMGSGFMICFNGSSDLELFPPDTDGDVSNLLGGWIEHEALTVGFVLMVRRGALVWFEGFTYDGTKWPEAIGDFGIDIAARR